MRGWIGVVLVAVTWTTSASVALAQTPPDVVMTQDGGMMRGTIVESRPGQHVVIALPTGETRRVAWSEVRFAGPAGEAPGSASVTTPPPSYAPYGTQEPSYGGAPPGYGVEGYGTGAPPGYGPPGYGPQPARAIRVRLVSAQPGVTFHRVVGSATAVGWGHGRMYTVHAHQFERLCTAPCDLTLPVGSHHFALSAGGAAVAATSLQLTGDSTIVGEYVDNSGLRAAGWITFGASLLAGGGMMLAPILGGNYDSGTLMSWMIAGGVVMLIGNIVGLALGFHGDGAVVRFE